MILPLIRILRGQKALSGIYFTVLCTCTDRCAHRFSKQQKHINMLILSQHCINNISQLKPQFIQKLLFCYQIFRIFLCTVRKEFIIFSTTPQLFSDTEMHQIPKITFLAKKITVKNCTIKCMLYYFHKFKT